MPESHLHRTTQKDIALLAKVDRTTVSLALRNHPSIPKTTQQRIKDIANRLNYSPDPMLSALIHYRNRKQTRSFQGTLAWLVNHQPVDAWREISVFCEYFEGASRQAKNYGYNIEVFHLHDEGMTPAKMARIFRSRNVSGILLCPQPLPNTRLAFPWERFSVVNFGYSLSHPQFHTTASTQFRAMTETMRQLYSLGYKRIGFACSLLTDKRTDHNYLAGYFVEKYLNEEKIDIPPFDEEVASASTFLKWYTRYHLDAIVTNNPRILGIIRQTGLQVPKDLGVACPTLPPPASNSSGLSGIYENSVEVGKAAVDFLVAKLQHGERGIPEQPYYIHVPGIWMPGRTLVRRKSALPGEVEGSVLPRRKQRQPN